MEHHSNSRTTRRRKGFALVIALSTMSFILVLLLSLTIMVRVETVNASTQLDRLRARESAKLALMMAIGDLQKHAGPDQRVTARADILGNTTVSEHTSWTGVWNTEEPNLGPTFLVSGESPQPISASTRTVTIYPGFDLDGDDSYTSAGEFEPTKVELVDVESPDVEIAWWVADEGIKAPLSITESFPDEVTNSPEDETYLDYNESTLRQTPQTHDPVFDFPLLFDVGSIDEGEEAKVELLPKIHNTESLSLLTGTINEEEDDYIEASLLHSTTLSNQFVLSNPSEGGLKKDLSYLKALDAATVTQNELDALYGPDAEPLVTPAAVKLVQFRGNPSGTPSDEVMGMQLDEQTVALTEAKAAHFSLAPVITEFQLGAGVVADKDEAASDNGSPLYLVYRVYLELWNPYTIPMMIGDSNLSSTAGYSDLKIEVKNLPNFSITGPSGSSSGSLEDISILWSDHGSRKGMNSGSTYSVDLPSNTRGTDGKGTIVIPLESVARIQGAANLAYTGNFTFQSGPIQIVITGINNSGAEAEILHATIANYENFTVDYINKSRTRLHRNFSVGGSAVSGRGYGSLVEPCYAFGIYFKMLHAQDTNQDVQDIENWLSEYDFRNRKIDVDLDEWDIDAAWDTEQPNPYTFDLTIEGTNPAYLTHSILFSISDFFHYETSNNFGRKDRIARVFDLPTGEVKDVSAFRALKFRDFHANAIGNSWGGNLNELYDRYFFSTLPDSEDESLQWDGEKALANPRLKEHKPITHLIDEDSASSLTLHNGFNINSTSSEAWAIILSGKEFKAGTLEVKEERTNFFDSTLEWETIQDPLTNAFFNFPQTGIYNLVDGDDNRTFQLLTRDSESDYIEQFSIDNEQWENDRQYPTFWQNIRELTDQEITDLSSAIVSEIKSYRSAEGHPFLSMANFLNSGALQAAINSVNSINLRSGDVDAIVPHTAAYVSQATLMNVLGPVGFVRSDTFKVRGYGAINGGTGSLTAAALCEATVQRLPDEHADTRFGRKFKIVGIRWLTPE